MERASRMQKYLHSVLENDVSSQESISVCESDMKKADSCEHSERAQ